MTIDFQKLAVCVFFYYLYSREVFFLGLGKGLFINHVRTIQKISHPFPYFKIHKNLTLPPFS